MSAELWQVLHSSPLEDLPSLLLSPRASILHSEGSGETRRLVPGSYYRAQIIMQNRSDILSAFSKHAPTAVGITSILLGTEESRIRNH